MVTLSGSVSSFAAGERVEILSHECGLSGPRVVAGTQAAGGLWSVTTEAIDAATFRARWRGALSRPLSVRTPVWPEVQRIYGRRAWRVTVHSPQNMRARPVVLQRRTRTGWVRVRQARLAAAGWKTYTAVFVVPTRGLMLRVVIPAASAAPCHSPVPGLLWRS